MSYALDNFVRSTLAVAAAAADTSLVLALAATPLRDPPQPAAGDLGVLILQNGATAMEIITYTGVSIVSTQVTLSGVTRGAEGTTAQDWPIGTDVFSGNTAAVMATKANVGDIQGVTVTNVVPTDATGTNTGHMWLVV